MNKKITLLAILFLATVSSIFSAPQLSERTKMSIVDYKNKNMGEPIPKWVKQVAMGNYHEPNLFTEVPNFDKHQNDEFFVISERGNDFEKLIIETENEMKNSYSSIVQRAMGKAMASKNITYQEPMESLTPPITTDNPSKFSLLSTSKLTEDANHFLQTFLCGSEELILKYTIGELPSYINKFCDFWIRYEVTNNNNNEVVDSYYDYYLVYTADQDSYQSEFKKMLNSDNYSNNNTTNNFSIKVKTPNGLSIFEKYKTSINISLNTEGNFNHSFIEQLVEQEESDIIPILSHSRAPNIELCKESSLEKDILTRFDLVLPKEKITPLVKNKNEIVVEVYNNDEYMCTDYFCIYELNQKDIKNAMKSYY